MAVKKTIAIVGATETAGAEIANRFSGMPYHLLLVSDKSNELPQLAIDISQKNPVAEIDTIECVKDGCWEADIIILAVPACEEKHVAEMMKEVATQKIVVVLSNGGAEHVLPYCKVVRVSLSSENKITVSGNNPAANEEIAWIFNHAGYRVETVDKMKNQISQFIQ
jgi:hypothetical protein